jgi:hypothetical protein
MKSTFCCFPGTVAVGKNWFFSGAQWIFAILAPSGAGLPFAGKPDLKAAIIAGLPTMTATAFSVELVEMASQLSNPLNSENARPPGTFTLYLSLTDGVGEFAAKASEAAKTAMPASAPRVFRTVYMFTSIGD